MANQKGSLLEGALKRESKRAVDHEEGECTLCENSLLLHLNFNYFLLFLQYFFVGAELAIVSYVN